MTVNGFYDKHEFLVYINNVAYGGRGLTVSVGFRPTALSDTDFGTSSGELSGGYV